MLRDVRGFFLRPDSGSEGGNSSESGDTTPVASGPVDLAAVRELILLAHPDAVPELVGGSNFDELIGSVEPARAAYQRVAESVRSTTSGATTEATAPKIPAGGGQRQTSINVEQLSPAAKISEGLRRRHSRGA